MATKINSVVVLLPNGRRQTLKVNLDSSVLQILEDVCKKHSFTSNEYDLKHHSKILDPTSVVRFSGLPNNAFLEMVPRTKQRKETKVVLSLQVDGQSDRFTDEFIPDSSLEGVLLQLFPSVVESSSDSKIPVIVYMRREIVGLDDIKKITLRSLGLTSGRALLRLMTRDSEKHPELQCSGVSILTAKASISRVSNDVGENSDVVNNENNQQVSSQERDFIVVKDVEKSLPPAKPKSAPCRMLTSSMKSEDISSNLGIINESDGDNKCAKVIESQLIEQTEIGQKENKHIELSKNILPQIKSTELQETDNNVNLGSSCISEVETKEQELLSIDDVKFLDEQHDGVIFKMEDSDTSLFHEDLPDSFFEVTLNDLKLLMRDLKQARMDMEETPLQTQELRDVQHQNKTIQYTKTILRVQFPDRFTLQGVFKPDDNIAEVVNFVRTHIQNPDQEFYLYTSPPKRILTSDETLLDANCVPCAKIYFAYTDHGSNTQENFLHDRLKSYLISQNLASYAAYQMRRSNDNKRKYDGTATNSCSSGLSSATINVAGGSQNTTNTNTNAQNIVKTIQNDVQNTVQKKSTNKIPKWFKPI